MCVHVLVVGGVRMQALDRVGPTGQTSPTGNRVDVIGTVFGVLDPLLYNFTEPARA